MKKKKQLKLEDFFERPLSYKVWLEFYVLI